MIVKDITSIIDQFCCIVVDNGCIVSEYENAKKVNPSVLDREVVGLEILSPIETNFPDACGLRIEVL